MLVCDDAELADSILDELSVRGLLQPSGPGTLVMHGLLWARARDLVAEVEDAATKDAAVERLVDWSLARLDRDYLPRLRASSTALPALPGDTGVELVLTDVFVDSPVVTGDGDGAAELGSLLAQRRQVLLTAPGGAGKTTMANHLCQLAARRWRDLGQGRIPFIVLARDVRDHGGGIELAKLIVTTLRHRYEFELAPQALAAALRQGIAMVVVDGLDEIVDDELRSALAGAILRLSRAHPDVPVLVTTRPYDRAAEDFPGFTRAHIAPWTAAMARQYLAKLRAVHGGRGSDGLAHHAHALPPSIVTPLGLQLLWWTDWPEYWPLRGLTGVVEIIVEQGMFLRELSRGTAPTTHLPAERRWLLEAFAFGMQSSPHNRVTATAAQLSGYVAAFAPELGPLPAAEVEMFARRFFVLQRTTRTTDGEPLFAFTHTVFREHLAASYLARQPADRFVDVMARYAPDPSWSAVFAASLELRQFGHGREGIGMIDQLVAGRNDPHLATALESWRRQVPG